MRQKKRGKPPALPSHPASLSCMARRWRTYLFLSRKFLLFKVDLSPRSISLLEAGENAGKQGIEKLLLVSGVNNSRPKVFLLPWGRVKTRFNPCYFLLLQQKIYTVYFHKYMSSNTYIVNSHPITLVKTCRRRRPAT